MESQSQSGNQPGQNPALGAIICTSCKTGNRSIAKFCKKCGVVIEHPAHGGQSSIELTLDGFAGLEDIKKSITEIINRVKIHNECRNSGLPANPLYLHSVFKGETGTGKTLIGNYFAQEFKKMGVITRESILNIDNETLDAEGNNLPNAIKNWIEKARGGILFFDEIHKSTECISSIVKAISTAGEDIIVIIAGLNKPLDDYFKENKEDLQRVGLILDFKNYTEEELLQITLLKLKSYGNKVTEDAVKPIKEYIGAIMYSGKNEYKNGWLVERFIIPKILNRQADRLKGTDSYSTEDLVQITAADIPSESRGKLSPDEILAQLDSMVGMDNIKKDVRELVHFANTQLMRETAGGKKKSIVPHIILTGNPGTGKTTVARMIGKLFNSIGILPSDHFVEVKKSDLIAQFVGHTGPKVDAVIDSAMGGVLFIDEAYALTPEGQSDTFSQDAINTLITRMENDRGRFVLIAAGYKKDMDRFLKSNSGLQSRFNKSFNFSDYKPEELEKIFLSLIAADEFKLSESALTLLPVVCRDMFDNRDDNFGNGRDIRNLIDNILQKQAVRISQLAEPVDQSLLWIIEAEDFPVEEKKEDSLEASLARLDKLTGLADVKNEVKELINLLKIEKLRDDGSSSKIGGHYVFTGNPGTGKTTVARILSEIFRNMGLLSKGHLVEISREGLIGEYVGSTAIKTSAVIDEAMGGVLFIDEAYSLVPEHPGNDYGPEAIATLLKSMADKKGKFIVIAAGYKNEMARFINSNPGLKERFQKTIEFKDYSPEELYSIFEGIAASKKMTMSDAFAEKVKNRLNDIYTNRSDTFANGRTVRNLFDFLLQRQSNRVIAIPSIKKGDPALTIFEAEDLV